MTEVINWGRFAQGRLFRGRFTESQVGKGPICVAPLKFALSIYMVVFFSDREMPLSCFCSFLVGLDESNMLMFGFDHSLHCMMLLAHVIVNVIVNI